MQTAESRRSFIASWPAAQPERTQCRVHVRHWTRGPADCLLSGTAHIPRGCSRATSVFHTAHPRPRDRLDAQAPDPPRMRGRPRRLRDAALERARPAVRRRRLRRRKDHAGNPLRQGGECLHAAGRLGAPARVDERELRTDATPERASALETLLRQDRRTPARPTPPAAAQGLVQHFFACMAGRGATIGAASSCRIVPMRDAAH